MKTTWKIGTALAGLFIVFANASAEPPVSAAFDAMRAGNYAEKFGRYTFPTLETNDIPELLEHATATNVLQSFPINMFSSIYRFTSTEGMVALWLIEGIRIGGKFPSLIPACYDKSKTITADAGFYAEADQEEVAKAYLTWWDRSKGASEDVGPLDGTTLTWFGGRTSEPEKISGEQAGPGYPPQGVGSPDP